MSAQVGPPKMKEISLTQVLSRQVVSIMRAFPE